MKRAAVLVIVDVAIAAWAITQTDERAFLACPATLLAVIGIYLIVHRRDANPRPGFIYDQERDR